MVRRGLITVSMLGVIALWHSPSGVARNHPDASPLAFKVSSYQVHNATIIEALRQLKLAVREESLIFTVEAVPFREKPENNLTLVLQDSTVGGILDDIVAQDPRYSYELVDSNAIHVFPRNAKTDPNDLLNVKVKHFEVSAAPYDLLLKYPQYHIPELQVELIRRSKAGGVVGHMMGGVDVPKVTLSLRDVTVRDVLNAIAQQTLEFAGSQHAATGWIYTFRIGESVPLGGHPRWDLF